MCGLNKIIFLKFLLLALVFLCRGISICYSAPLLENDPSGRIVLAQRLKIPENNGTVELPRGTPTEEIPALLRQKRKERGLPPLSPSSQRESLLKSPVPWCMGLPFPVCSLFNARVNKVLVAPGDGVRKNQVLFELEMMKMSFPMCSPASGKIEMVNVKAGEIVGTTLPLLSLMPENPLWIPLTPEEFLSLCAVLDLLFPCEEKKDPQDQLAQASGGIPPSEGKGNALDPKQGQQFSLPQIPKTLLQKSDWLQNLKEQTEKRLGEDPGLPPPSHSAGVLTSFYAPPVLSGKSFSAKTSRSREKSPSVAALENPRTVFRGAEVLRSLTTFAKQKTPSSCTDPSFRVPESHYPLNKNLSFWKGKVITLLWVFFFLLTPYSVPLSPASFNRYNSMIFHLPTNRNLGFRRMGRYGGFKYLSGSFLVSKSA